MRIKSLSLKDVRSFERIDNLELAEGINVLIGMNNSGKSTILRAIHCVQGATLNSNDFRLGGKELLVQLELTGDQVEREFYDAAGNPWETHIRSDEKNVIIKLVCKLRPGNMLKQAYSPGQGGWVDVQGAANVNGQNAIIPFLSGRKVVHFKEQVDSHTQKQITGTFENLYARIDGVNNPALPEYPAFKKACEDILGFHVTTVASPGGKIAGYYLSQDHFIPLTSMGEGVINIVGLLVDLVVSEGKIFLIEEAENDLHPKAMKAIAKIIREKSKSNQFIISTHSHILTKELGLLPETRIFSVYLQYFRENGIPPKSEIKQEENTPENRVKIMEGLGYEFSDYEMQDGWLFFEESSAEEIIRDYLIPWFFSNSVLCKFRTFSAKSVAEVEKKFHAFNDLFVFLHLIKVYLNKAWVIIDDGPLEAEVIRRLKEQYLKHGWEQSHFTQFSKHEFEDYYPARFALHVKEFKESRKEDKRRLKAELLQRVKLWISMSPEEAKTEFQESAKDVIALLSSIESQANVEKVSGVDRYVATKNMSEKENLLNLPGVDSSNVIPSKPIYIKENASTPSSRGKEKN